MNAYLNSERNRLASPDAVTHCLHRQSDDLHWLADQGRFGGKFDWPNEPTLIHERVALRKNKMVKTNRSGQAASLSPEQLDRIMAACQPKLRAALSVCRFTACRISECLSLRWENIMQDTVVFPRMITKKKMATREVPISPKLQPILAEWKSLWPSVFKRDFDRSDFVVPAPSDISKHWARPRVDEGLRAACKIAGIEGLALTAFEGVR